jgi:hypothetical protein
VSLYRFTAKAPATLDVFGRRVELTPGGTVDLSAAEWLEVRAIAAGRLRPVVSLPGERDGMVLT